MMMYVVTWANGRAVGAIGSRYSGGMIVEAATSEAAVLEVYKHYEHLQGIEIQEVPDARDTCTE